LGRPGDLPQRFGAFRLVVKRAGWKSIYDPAVAVDHHAAPRFLGDSRASVSAVEVRNDVHNQTLMLLEYLLPCGDLRLAAGPYSWAHAIASAWYNI
jgi:hypothetical protein